MLSKKNLFLIAIIFILAIGFFLRVYNIDNLPPGIYPDEAANGEDAIRANATGNYQWFYPANTGREGLFMNLIALSFLFFGASIFSLKLPAIIFGTLSIFGVYLFSKELFQKERLAFVAGFFYAVSFWAINFSRISFRANMLPAILTFSFYFLFKGLRTKKWTDFSLGGLIFGIGMHSYIAWRIAPLILIAMLFFFFLSRKNFFQEHWKNILLFLFASVASAFPMFLTFYYHPEYLEARDSLSVFSPQINQGHPFQLLLKTFALSLQKYNFVGDMNWRHNFPPYPLLDQLTGLFFVAGMIIAFRKTIHILHQILRQRKNILDLEKYSFLLLWFFLMLAPEFMAGEGNPHALRSIGTLPVAIIFSALGFDYFIEKFQKKFPERSGKILGIFLAILFFIGIFNAVKYHIFWAQKIQVASSFNKNATDIYRYIKTLPKNQTKYVITTSNTLIRLPIFIFTSEDSTIHYVYPQKKISPSHPEDSVFIFIEKNEEIIADLQKKYSYLTLEEMNYSLESKFYILKK